MKPWQLTESSARGANTVTIYALHTACKPAIRLDGLEIVAGHWLTAEEALTQPLVSHVREYLEQIS